MDYAGKPIKSREIIGYNPKTKAFSSCPMDATFQGKFSPDGNSFSGGWRPNPGADETINTAYDITVSRVK